MHLLYGTLSESAANIDSCVFSDGVDISGETKLPLSSGLVIFCSRELLNQYFIDISLSNVFNKRNVAKSGAKFPFSLK